SIAAAEARLASPEPASFCPKPEVSRRDPAPRRAPRAERPPGPAIGAQLLLSPVTDCDLDRPSFEENAEGKVIGSLEARYRATELEKFLAEIGEQVPSCRASSQAVSR
ncbi:MAG: hypothetical protein M0Z82_10100, partial [Actinomycetota bacterium]|nr:hypothetical protein [Actinomycetota bacterium]